MRSFNKILATFFLGAAFSVNIAQAAQFSFDGGAGVSLSEYSQTADIAVPRAVPAPSAAGAHVYDFGSLYKSLGYPSPDYFGSTEEELMDLDSYTSKGDPFYEEINGYLRFYPEPYDWYGTGPEDAKVIVKHIDNIFRRVPVLPADLILFRGLGLGWHGNKPFAAGEEFTDKGYVSTSASFKVAYHFAAEMGDPDKPSRRALFVMYLARQGERGILIEKENEEEVILGHGRRFRVMASKDASPKYDLYLVQVCAAACDTTLRSDVASFWGGFVPD